MFGFKKFATGGIVNNSVASLDNMTIEERLKKIEERLSTIEGKDSRTPVSWFPSFHTPSLPQIQERLINLTRYLGLEWVEVTKEAGYQEIHPKRKPKYPHQDGHKK